MAPSAESSNGDDLSMETAYPQYPPSALAATTPSKNVAFAVNYELPLVDQFLSLHPDSRRRNTSRGTHVETPTKPTAGYQSHHPETAIRAQDVGTASTSYPLIGIQQRIPSSVDHDSVIESREENNSVLEQHPSEILPHDWESQTTTTATTTTSETQNSLPLRSPTNARRVSTRDKHKREVPLARTRVRYDMQLVPPVRRNKVFLDYFVPWWLTGSAYNEQCDTTNDQSVQQQKRRSSRILPPPTQQEDQCCISNDPLLLSPFAEDDASVVWIPTKRSEWEDTISEMTAVCTSAAMRRYIQQQESNDESATSQKYSQLPFQPPLSRDYIRDRIDIDDPLNGYQIRHRYGGWMQGFILYTTFTTWTYGFRWDSNHPLCGITRADTTNNTATDNHNCYIDHNGSLAIELESLSRSGDPSAGGIVFPTIAEIGLLGGLGCGEYLLRMALDDIYTKCHYKYVVLQATEQSRPFYERFGFVRVGAICHYGRPNLQQPLPEQAETEIMGYRHWTHANESERSLQMHGGPSYMMCLKLSDCSESNMEDTTVCDGVLQPPKPGAFAKHLLKKLVESKPRVEQLGASTTPARRSNSMPIEISASFDYNNAAQTNNDSQCVSHGGRKATIKNGASTKISRRKSFAGSSLSGPQTSNTCLCSGSLPRDAELFEATINESTTLSNAKKRMILSNDLESSDMPRTKRLKVDINGASKKGRRNSSVLQSYQQSTYVAKQYNSIWLAVPPVPSGASSPRRGPPKCRDDTNAGVNKQTKSISTDVKETTIGSKSRAVGESNDRIRQNVFPMNLRKSEWGIDQAKLANQNLPTGGTTEQGTMSYSQLVSFKKRTFLETITENKSIDIAESATSGSNLYQPGRRTSFINKVTSGQPSQIDRMTIKKQKVLSYPRNRMHYYNRVVQRMNTNEDGMISKLPESDHEVTFYFVLEYNESSALVCLVPMMITGTLLGKRFGRPRYQCMFGESDDSFIVDHATNYIVIPSAMIMKTPVVAQEAWDIATDKDVDFVTR
jgi:hypothetical protein